MLFLLKFLIEINFLIPVPLSPSPQNVEHRRGRKRRSYEKYGNIVSLYE